LENISIAQMTKPEVSWMIPVLNGETYLEEALASIESQTHKNYEVLVWDNGSTDGTLAILSDWIPRRLPGRVIRDQPSTLRGSLNGLIALSKADYCARMDADDINHPERLAKQLAFLKCHPDVAVLGSQVIHIEHDGRHSAVSHRLPIDHEAIMIRMIHYWSMWHPTVLIRRKALVAAGGYMDEKPVEDYGLWLRLSRQGRLCNLPDPLLYYRVHNSSVTSSALKAGTLIDETTKLIMKYGPHVYGLSPDRIMALRQNSRNITMSDFYSLTMALLQNSSCSPLLLIKDKTWKSLFQKAMESFPQTHKARGVFRHIRAAVKNINP
jgi:glycosyltransferase involved in cell wall biosynthesis